MALKGTWLPWGGGSGVERFEGVESVSRSTPLEEPGAVCPRWSTHLSLRSRPCWLLAPQPSVLSMLVQGRGGVLLRPMH